MRLNRALAPIQVISFDLDDTLYDNSPIIKKAINAQQDYLNSLPLWAAQPGDYWRTCRNNYAKHHPEVVDDVTRWRQQALLHGMQQLNIDNAQYHAQQAYQAFATARSDIKVAQSVVDLLFNLRQHYKIIAITNGNVDIAKFNLASSFDFVLQAGPNGAAKPKADMFQLAAKRLNVAMSSILHVGDSLDTDVQGANDAGCQSVWLKLPNTHYHYLGLADLEITDIQQLNALIK